MSQITTASHSQSLFPRARQSLANAAKRLEIRQRVERELGSLSDRALADIGLYRSDISEFATAASVSPASEPLLQAIAVQTFRSATRSEREKFEGRLGALAQALGLLGKGRWQGSDLADVVKRVLQPHMLSSPDRIRISGPSLPLSPRTAVVLSMILHEMATNAAKYGALSNDTGKVVLDWEVDSDDAGPLLRLIWTETGGPRVVAPLQRGFGSRLIERSARDQLGGEATVDFLPTGVVYTVICALKE